MCYILEKVFGTIYALVLYHCRLRENASVYKTRFKKKMIDSVSVEELDWSA